jgi:plastocyanin
MTACMLRRALIGSVLFLSAVQASAAPLMVRVVDAKGRPVRDAVVTVQPRGVTARPAVAGGYSVSQKDMQFHPFVLVVPVGAKVSFPNVDPTRHHVYSFSPARQFELKLFARDQSRSVVFDKPGVVALGCNIHDAMTAFIIVTDSRWTAKTGANGVAQFADAPNSAGRVTVWHPYLRTRANVVEQQVPAANRNVSFTVALRAAPMTSDAY